MSRPASPLIGYYDEPRQVPSRYMETQCPECEGKRGDSRAQTRRPLDETQGHYDSYGTTARPPSVKGGRPAILSPNDAAACRQADA
jgi:hypothetical protein